MIRSHLLAGALALLFIPATGLTLLTCSAPAAGAQAEAQARAEAQAEAQGRIRFGAGNIFQSDSPGRIAEKLDDVADLGLTHVSVASAFGGYSGPSRRALAILDALQERGLTVKLGINGDYRQEQQLTEAGVEAAGEAWGTALRPYAADGTLYAVSVDNEPNLLAHHFRRTQGAEAAAEILERSADLAVAFARGVKRTCPDCSVMIPALGGFEIKEGGALSIRYLETLRPHVGTLFEPILQVHRYSGRHEFEFDRRTGDVTGWNVDFSAELDALLPAAGWPRDVEIAVTETNVKAWGDPERQAQALRAMVQHYRADPRIRLVTFFTPWLEGERPAGRDYDIDRGDPRWDAVRDVAQ